MRETDKCTRCNGDGRRNYDNSSTWRRGIGAAAITRDLCDLCWGSGDKWHPFASLRELADDENARIERRAGELLTAALGGVLCAFTIKSELEDYCRKRAAGRKCRDAIEQSAWLYMASCFKKVKP